MSAGAFVSQERSGCVCLSAFVHMLCRAVLCCVLQVAKLDTINGVKHMVLKPEVKPT